MYFMNFILYSMKDLSKTTFFPKIPRSFVKKVCMHGCKRFTKLNSKCFNLQCRSFCNVRVKKIVLMFARFVFVTFSKNNVEEYFFKYLTRKKPIYLFICSDKNIKIFSNSLAFRVVPNDFFLEKLNF